MQETFIVEEIVGKMLPQHVISTEHDSRESAHGCSNSRASTPDTASTLCSEGDDERCFSLEIHSKLEGMANRFAGLLNSQVPLGSTVVPLLIRCMKLLMSCKYDYLDISSVLAVTVVHHNSLISRLAQTSLSEKERSFIILAQMFIAHSIVLDECVVLSNWHKYLFSSYCDVNCLKRAIARILKRMEYTLSVDPDQASHLAHIILNFS